jgi:hypothetical protein
MAAAWLLAATAVLPQMFINGKGYRNLGLTFLICRDDGAASERLAWALLSCSHQVHNLQQ